MFYPGETVVHKSRDDFGDLIIADSDYLRSLYFGTEKRQSTMLLDHPGILVLEYTRIAMLSFMLLRNDPQRVLTLGMGGGSIPKFVLRAFPSAKVDVVELRDSVIRLAYAYFAVPENHKNLKVINDDARNFVQAAFRRGQQYDVLFLDAYDQDGPSDLMTDIEFWRRCKALLTPQGLMCVNLWNRREDRFQKQFHRLRMLFSGSVYQYATEKKNGNAVVFCMEGDSNVSRLSTASTRALDWQKRFGLDMPLYLSKLKRQNFGPLHRWFK